MKTAAEIPAVLTVHETAPGQYVLRTADLKYRRLLVEVSKLLPNASSLVVVTPSDIKVFKVGGEATVDEPGAGTESGAEADPSLDPEMAAAIAEQEGSAIPGQVAEPEITASGAEVVGETAQGAKVVRRKRTPAKAGTPSNCGRCRGTGRISVILEGGQGAEAPCGVCGGTGQVTRYGAQR